MRSTLFPALSPALTRALGAALAAVLLPLALATPAVAGGHAGPDPVTSLLEARRAPTELRLSGPAGLVDPGVHRFGARLLTEGRPLPDAPVRLERRTPEGWQEVTTVRTDAEGLAVAHVALGLDARLRAVHDGSAAHAGSTSREVVVDVATFRERALRLAAEQEGKPYRYGATGPDSFDCSGYVQWVFRQVGRSLPRTSRQQRAATPRVPTSAKQPGDLVFLYSGGRVTHVGIYAGDERMWVAPKAGDVVKLQRIYSSAHTVGRVD